MPIFLIAGSDSSACVVCLASALIDAVVVGCTYIVRRDALDVCARAEEAALAGEDGEDGIRMLVEDAQGRDGVFDDVAAEGVERFGAVELNRVRCMRRTLQLKWVCLL
jgi:hypothetical protein